METKKMDGADGSKKPVYGKEDVLNPSDMIYLSWAMSQKPDWVEDIEQ